MLHYSLSQYLGCNLLIYTFDRSIFNHLERVKNSMDILSAYLEYSVAAVKFTVALLPAFVLKSWIPFGIGSVL
jgi:hypothetical protein